MGRNKVAVNETARTIYERISVNKRNDFTLTYLNDFCHDWPLLTNAIKTGKRVKEDDLRL